MQGNKQIKEVGVTGILASFTVESDFIIALWSQKTYIWILN